MNKIAILFTDYIIKKGMIEEADHDTYTYGFVRVLETGLSIICSLCIAALLGMIIEGILFFLIFIPLRSYAGGLHLEKYWSCFILSCLNLCTVLLIVKFLHVNIYLSFSLLTFFIFLVYFLYPVENKNRMVKADENEFFKMKLKRYLCLDVILAVFFMIIKKDDYLLMIAATFFMIAVTMVLGSVKYKKHNA